MAEPLRIALAGLGTVGAAVIRLIETNAPLITARAGRPLEVVAVSARSRSREPPVRGRSPERRDPYGDRGVERDWDRAGSDRSRDLVFHDETPDVL